MVSLASPSRWMALVAAVLVLGVSPAVAQDPALVEAVRAGDRPAALELLRAGSDPDSAQADGTSALHWAVYRVDVELVKALLERGARPDVANDFGSAPLAEAVKVANVDLVRLLLQAGADTEARNHDGQTALMLAARIGHLDIAKLLVKHGADVDARETWRGQTALMWAAASDHPEVVEYLIGRGADVDVRAVVNDWGNQVTSEPRAQYRPSGGMTPLLYAVRSGCRRCVEAILEAGAGIDVPNPDGVTPLMTAIDNLHFELALWLVDQGANPHVADWWGRTALYLATDAHTLTARAGPVNDREPRSRALDVMRRLLAAGVDPDPQLNFHRPGRGGSSGRFTDDLLTVGATPLLRAAISFDLEAIRLLLDHGAQVDLPNGMGVTPFMVAAGLGVSIRDPRGSHTAQDAQRRSIETMKVLLAAGADVNARVTDTSSRTARIARPSTMTSRQGQTALYGAINWGWTEVVAFLLGNGARVDIADARGKTPLDATRGDAGGRDHKTVPEIVAMIGEAAGVTGS